MSRKKAFDYVVVKTRSGAGRHSDAVDATAIRCEAKMGRHRVSTCRAGRDEDKGAVLDRAARVVGADRLRVADASAFSDQSSGNLNAAVIMMAEGPHLPREYV